MKPERVLCVGDIHGAYKALLKVLHRANVDFNTDQLIFLGDYVDGWSESAEVIEHLLLIEEKSRFKPIFLRGNHDKWCEDWLLKGQSPLIWTQQGGQSTIDSYVRTNHLVKDTHRKFFKSLQNFYIDENNNGFVHGGFRSRKGLGHEVYQADYYWDRDLWNIALMSNGRIQEEPNLARGVSSGRRFERHKEIFIGHTSTVNWIAKGNTPERHDENQVFNGPITIPMNRCNVWNMDTGAGFYGKLTIMDIETKEFWQSPFVKDLYPEEKGR